MRLTRVLAAITAALPLALLPAAAGQAGPPSPAGYLALGDSVAAGVGAPAGQGYVPLLAGDLAAARNCGQGQALGCRIELDNRSVGGATTVSLISGQLPGAVTELRERNGNRTPVDDVRLITITIGGNDVFTPVIAACAAGFSATCQATVAAQFAQVSANYATILGQLREAAGPKTTIAVMTYYNPLPHPGCRFTSLTSLGDLVLEGGGPLTSGLNDIIRTQAAAFGAVVVETGAIVAPTEVQPDCLHPNTAGHADIAEAFYDAVGISVVGGPGGR
jgi:lysophospholipase L1-like esterase